MVPSIGELLTTDFCGSVLSLAVYRLWKGISGMPGRASVSQLILQLGSLQAVPGVGGGESGYRSLDEGEMAAATLVGYGEAATYELMEALNSANWIVRYRAADALRIIGSCERPEVLGSMFGLWLDHNLHVHGSADEAIAELDLQAGRVNSRPARVSALAEFLQQSVNFDRLLLLAVFGTGDIRQIAQDTVEKIDGFEAVARLTVLDASLSYAEQSRTFRALEAIWKQINRRKEFDSSPLAPARVCAEINRTGSDGERATAMGFVQHWQSERQNLRPGSAPVDPGTEYVRPASFGAISDERETSLRYASAPEPGSLPVDSSASRSGGRNLWNLFGLWRSRSATPAPPNLSSGNNIAVNNVVLNNVAVNDVVVNVVPQPPSVVVKYAQRTRCRVWVSTAADMEMIVIPEGEFLMGDEDLSNNPRRRVYLDSYSISKYPVTVKQYMEFVHATGYPSHQSPDWKWYRRDHPIVNVSWEDAQAYCEWLSLAGPTMTLPTEAEWEKGARGIEGLRYPWGNEWNAMLCANDLPSTVAVGSYLLGVSPYGVQDMAGNVWEWCSDWYDSTYMPRIPRAATHHSNGSDWGHARVLRGGSWTNSNEDYFRCALRYRHAPDYWDNIIGFRCASPVVLNCIIG